MCSVESKKQFQQVTKAKNKNKNDIEWHYCNFIGRHDEGEEKIKRYKNNEKIN
jgi:hypothetical protein